MGDFDQDRETMRESERTTVIDTSGAGGGDRRNIALVALILLLGIAAVAYFAMSGGADNAAEEIGINVNVPTQVELPDVNVNLPDVNVALPDVAVPDVDVKTGGEASGNQSR